MLAGCCFEVLREIILKKALINMRSIDNTIAWLMVVALYPAKSHMDRKSSSALYY